MAAAVVLLDSAESAALVAVVLREPAVPVRARLLVLADPHPLREPAAPVLAQVPVLVVHRVREPEVPVHLRSRQSFSAAMARISPPPEKPTYERVPRSR